MSSFRGIVWSVPWINPTWERTPRNQNAGPQLIEFNFLRDIISPGMQILPRLLTPCIQKPPVTHALRPASE
jgi:hypothetical protein